MRRVTLRGERVEALCLLNYWRPLALPGEFPSDFRASSSTLHIHRIKFLIDNLRERFIIRGMKISIILRLKDYISREPIAWLIFFFKRAIHVFIRELFYSHFNWEKLLLFEFPHIKRNNWFLLLKFNLLSNLSESTPACHPLNYLIIKRQ